MAHAPDGAVDQSAAQPASRALLIAHRGESHLAPENTLASIELAWSNGCQAVEFDVRLTRDDRLVVCHDADLRRTGGDGRVIREHDLASLEGVDVGRWKGAQWAGQRLATLEQVMATIPPGGRVFLEVKEGVESVEPLTRVIRRHDPAKCVVISFHQTVIAAVKHTMPAVEACWLSSFSKARQSGRWVPDATRLLETAKAIHADGLDLEAGPAVSGELVTALHGGGLKVYVWTVDDPAEARRLLDCGVDGVTTNRPTWLAAAMAAGSM